MKFLTLMFVWPYILNMKWFVRPTWCNNYDLLINLWLNMFREPLCPSSGVQGCTLLHMVFSTYNSLYTVHTTCLPASQNSCQHFNPLNAELNPIYHLLALLGAHHILHFSRIRVKCWKPYAVVYSLALLKVGTVVPETCWVIGLSINHNGCIKLI